MSRGERRGGQRKRVVRGERSEVSDVRGEAAAVLLAEGHVVLVVEVEVLQRGEVLHRRRHVAAHLIVVHVERDQLAQITHGGPLREVAIELVVL